MGGQADEPILDLDLDLAAVFAGQALSSRVLARVLDTGFAGLRFSHGYLFQLLIGGSKTIGELATAQGVSQQAVSQMVAELDHLGYLARDVSPDDGRKRLVRLTERGRAAIDASRQARKELAEEVRAALGPQRVDAAVDLLVDVINELGGMDAIRSRSVRPTP